MTMESTGMVLARAHPQTIADSDEFESDILIAIGADAPRGFRRKAEQCLDRARGALACAQLQYLPEQHEGP